MQINQAYEAPHRVTVSEKLAGSYSMTLLLLLLR
jgi:hypothetical protein